MTPFHAYSFVAAVIGFIMISVGVSQIINERSAARYEELSLEEADLLRECVRQQAYADCLENVYQLRQLGIDP